MTPRQRWQRRRRIEGSPNFTLIQGGAGEEESGPALSPFGPLRVGLIIGRTTPTHLPSVSHNDWERRTSEPLFRYLKDFAIYNTDTKPRAVLGLIGSSATTTNEGGRG